MRAAFAKALASRPCADAAAAGSPRRSACPGSRRPAPAIRCRASRRREFQEFRLGLEDFAEIEEPSEGLGPLFNGAGCAACHNVPAIGGSTPDDRDARRAPRRRRQVSRRRRHHAVPDVFDAGPPCQAVMPPEVNVDRAAHADSAVRRGTGRSGARRDAAGARGSVRSRSRRHQRPRGDVIDKATRTAPRRPVRLEGADRHAADLLRRRLHQRDGHHQRRVSRSSRSAASRKRGCANAICVKDPGGPGRSAHRQARDRQLRSVHEISRAAAARPDHRRSAGRRAGVRRRSAAPRVTCRRCRPAPTRRPRSIARRWRCFRTCCCTISAPATASSRKPRSQNEIRTPALWGLRLRRPLLHDGSAATPCDAIAAMAGKRRP